MSRRNVCVRPEWLFEAVGTFQAAAIAPRQATGDRVIADLRSSIPAPRTHVEELLLKGLLALAQLGIEHQTPHQNDAASSRCERVEDRAASFIRQHCCERLTYALIGRELGCDAENLEMRFHARFGESLHAYLRRIRINAAVDAIRKGEKVEAVALQVGFQTKSGFLRAFRAVTGTTPARLRS